MGKIVKEHELKQSMSRVGKCIDNEWIESFWETLKVERYYLHKYDYYEELVDSITDYVRFNKEDSLQVKFNGLSPMEFRTKAVV